MPVGRVKMIFVASSFSNFLEESVDPLGDGAFGFQVVGSTPDRPAVAGDFYAVEVDRDLQARAATMCEQPVSRRICLRYR
jgi:hypothetical protein